MRSIKWIFIVYASALMVSFVSIYLFFTQKFSFNWVLFSGLIFPLLAIWLIKGKDKTQSRLDVTYTPMSFIYNKFDRENGNVDRLLKFNLDLCSYCRYQGSVGAIVKIDFDHLKSMSFCQDYFVKTIIDKMEKYSDKKEGKAFFLIQKNISPYSFLA